MRYAADSAVLDCRGRRLAICACRLVAPTGRKRTHCHDEGLAGHLQLVHDPQALARLIVHARHPTVPHWQRLTDAQQTAQSFGQLPGAQRVINSLAREWLNHTSRVSDEKKIFVSWRNSRAGERCDGAPRLILRKTKLLLGPTAQSRHL